MTSKFSQRLKIAVVVSSVIVGAIVLNERVFNLVGGGTAVDNEVAGVSVFKEAAKPVYLSPKKVKFKEKELGVVEVDAEDDGTLGVPSSWQTAGWYKNGAKAGEEGNVIIDGHYDTNTGAPGAFWELKNLQVGDKVFLTDSLGRIFEYSVVNKSFISIKDPERAKVFGSGKEKALTLITCGGVWDYASGTYNKRLVISAVFDKMEKGW